MRLVALVLVTAVSAVTLLYSYSVVTPCQVPIRFSIGSIDPVFAMTDTELQAAVTDALAVWEPLSDRTLFVYDEQAPLMVNLIFDERHERFQTKEMWQAELNQLESRFRTAEEQFAAAEQRYNQLVAELRTAEGQYTEAVAAVRTAEAAGESAEVINRLIASVVALESVVNQAVDETNTAVAAMNDLVDGVNQAARLYNEEAEAYNRQFGTSEEFTQGDFTRDSINIYTFQDRVELTRVLAHEFGHALGLEHVEGEDSIMYYMVSAQTVPARLSHLDKAEFYRVCQTDDSLQARLTHVSAPINAIITNLFE